MIKYDMHVHTEFSSDSEEKVENQINEAMKKGLKGICITDHIDLEFPEKEAAGCDFLFDLNSYFDTLGKIRDKYKSCMNVMIGVEFGLRNEAKVTQTCIDGYKELAKKYDFDFIIGSTHCLDFCDPYYPKYWENKSSMEGLENYFCAVRDNVNSYDDFDSLGHLDYLVRYVQPASVQKYLSTYSKVDYVVGRDVVTPIINDEKDFRYVSYDNRKSDEVIEKFGYRPMDYADIFDEILKKIIDNGKALEINSAGLKYGIGFAHPRMEILRRYRELGGELITIGSDAHAGKEIAFGFWNVFELLENLGYKYYFVYENRKPRGILL